MESRNINGCGRLGNGCIAKLYSQITCRLCNLECDRISQLHIIECVYFGIVNSIYAKLSDYLYTVDFHYYFIVVHVHSRWTLACLSL
jgi:hypothetical protein